MDEFINSLNLNFEFEVAKNEGNIFTLRSNISIPNDAELFVSEIEKRYNVQFMFNSRNRNPRNIIFHQKWVCRRSSKHKRKWKATKRNAHCGSFVDVLIKKVNKNTIRNDVYYLKRKVPLPCVIKLNMEHSHETDTAAALRMMRVTPEVQQQFENYFRNGMKVAESIRFHESKIISEKGMEKLSDARYNPTQSQAYRIYHNWKVKNYSLSTNPFSKLEENLQKYESEGATVRYCDKEPWCVLIVTPVMKRAQVFGSSEEIIFLDSTSGYEGSSSTLTVLLTTTEIGVIPIAVLVHQYKTTESFENAFNLLKENFPLCFGGKEAPNIFMTDDISAERKALRKCWISSKYFYCHFHVIQSEWRWLMSANSDIIKKEDRKHAMKLFQTVMCARNETDLLEAKENILNMHEEFPSFVSRFKKNIQRGNKWLLFSRLKFINSDYSTINYYEASIRMLKGVILNRAMALNFFALVDFFLTILDSHLTNKLLEHVYGNTSEHSRLYADLADKVSHASAIDILQIDDEMYLMPSSCQKNIKYIVEANIGCCTCNVGRTGAICKHQYFLMDHCKLKLPNAPNMPSDDRWSLAYLALGDKCLEEQLFSDIKPNDVVHAEQREVISDQCTVTSNEHAVTLNENTVTSSEHTTLDEHILISNVHRVISNDLTVSSNHHSVSSDEHLNSVDLHWDSVDQLESADQHLDSIDQDSDFTDQDSCILNQNSGISDQDSDISDQDSDIIDQDLDVSDQHSEKSQHSDIIDFTLSCLDETNIKNKIELLHTDIDHTESLLNEIQHTSTERTDHMQINLDQISSLKSSHIAHEKKDHLKHLILKEIERLLQFDIDVNKLTVIAKELSKITNSAQLNNTLTAFITSFKLRREQSKISSSSVNRKHLDFMSRKNSHIAQSDPLRISDMKLKRKRKYQALLNA